MAPVPPATKIRTEQATHERWPGIGVGVCRFGPGLWQDVVVTDQSGYPGAPPGWYPDPAGGPGQRWWDGYAWTESTVLPQQPPPPPWASASPPQGPPTTIAPWAEASQRLSTFTTASLVDNELRLAPLARFAVALPAVYFLVNLIENRINAQALLNAGHQFRADFHDAEVGKTAPPYHGVTPGYGGAVLPPLRADSDRGDRGLRVAAPGGVRRAGPGPPGSAFARLGSGRLVRAHRQRIGFPTALSGTACPRATRIEHACCTGGSPG